MPTTAPPPTTTEPTRTAAPTTSAAPTTTQLVAAAPPEGLLWPAPGGPTFVDAVEAARFFVADVVGVDDPQPPLSPARSARPDTAEIDVLARNEDGSARNTVVSTVALRRVDGHWYITGATAAELQVDTPAPDEEISWPVRVAGQGTGYEGTIAVEVRDAFAGPDDLLGFEVTMGGANGEIGPFEAPVAYSAPAGDRGFVLVRNDS